MLTAKLIKMAHKGDEDDGTIEPEETPGYKAPAPKSLADIVKADAEDESLAKYKAMLLGAASTVVEVCKYNWTPANAISY